MKHSNVVEVDLTYKDSPYRVKGTYTPSGTHEDGSGDFQLIWAANKGVHVMTAISNPLLQEVLAQEAFNILEREHAERRAEGLLGRE